MVNQKSNKWLKSNLQVFWGELAPCDHVVQIYENDKIFLDSLEGFIGAGLLAGDGIIIIATQAHILSIEERLNDQGFDLESMVRDHQFIALDAVETLSKFMVNNWPNEDLFIECISGVLELVRQKNRKVRAFGEMVALLWEQGYHGATVQLESLWNRLHKEDGFTLFCSYPKSGFTQNIQASVASICSEHHKIIDGSPRPSTEIYYQVV